MSDPSSPAFASAPAPAPAPVPAPDTGVAKSRRRRVRYLLAMFLVPLMLAAGVGYYWLAAAGTVSTDNANLHLARVSIAPSVGGRVVTVAVSDLQAVKAGDLLFRVDPEPYRMAVTQAEAAVAGARLQVEQMKAAWLQAVAQETLAIGNAEYLEHELARKGALAERGVATTSDLDDARHQARQAREQAGVASAAVAAALAALGGNPEVATDTHPAVAAALATLDEAQYDLSQTTVTAPADGLVAQAASFRPGAMVSPGTPVFALVETGTVWVDANFKETQIAGMLPGQKAEVVLDMNRNQRLSGSVEAIGAGTGAEFSLLPAQNATGNWVKVTQRVPVRIRLDRPGQAAGLATGLSAEVTVSLDTDSGGFMAAQAAD